MQTPPNGQLPDPDGSSPLDQLPDPDPASPLDQLPPPEEISGTLRDILSGPEFATFEAPTNPSIIAELFGLLLRVFEWIMRLFGRDASGLLQTLAVLLPLLALVAAGVIVIRRRRDAVRRPADGGDVSGEVVPVTPSEWLKLASERAGQGALRSAATALYQGFLLTLDGRGALAYHPSKTPGDYTREMSRTYGPGTSGHAGGRFLNSFQGFSFGQESPTDDAYADLTRLAREAGCEAEGPDPEPGPATSASEGSTAP